MNTKTLPLRKRIYNALFEENGDFTPRGTLLFMTTFIVVAYVAVSAFNTWAASL